MKKNLTKTWLLAYLAASLTTAAYAQENPQQAEDSIAISTIVFEYDDSGSVVLEAMADEKEETENDDELEALLGQEEVAEQQEQERTKDSPSRMGQEEHLSISGSDGRTIKVVLYDYEDYAAPTLRVHSLSGIQMFTAPISEALSTFSLADLPAGIYVVSLTLNGEQETKKVSLQ